jgi:hypothetical protein
MVPIRDEVRALGADLFAIGNGTAPMARDFALQFDVGFPVFTDPSRRSYKAAGLVRNFGIGLGTVAPFLQALRQGHRQGATKGDAFQQGGVLIVDTGGAVQWRHTDSGAGDSAEPADVLAALREVARS